MANISGTNGVDTLVGTFFADRIYGLSSGDSLYGGEGSDTHFGASGFDLVFGASGDDLFDEYNPAGDGEFFGGLGDDSAFGGLDYDRLRGDRARTVSSAIVKTTYSTSTKGPEAIIYADIPGQMFSLPLMVTTYRMVASGMTHSMAAKATI